MNTIAVVGTGKMGRGIARAASNAGLRVMLVGRSMAALNAAMDAIDTARARKAEQGAPIDLHLFEATPLVDAELVIECVAEQLALKGEIFAELAKRTGRDTILATNTSSLSVTAIGKLSGDPARVIGIHFFNPPHIMPLVEVVSGLETSISARECARDFAQRLKKRAIEVRDVAGFIVNRLLFAQLREACLAAEHQVASIEEIEAAARLGLGHPMGPFALMDLIGLDVCVSILEALQTTHGAAYSVPRSLLERARSSNPRWL